MKSKNILQSFGLVSLTLMFSLPALAGKPLSKRHSSFYDYITSSEFNCSVTSKRIFKPGSVSQDYDYSRATPACLLTVTCNPIPGVDAKSVTAAPMCLANSNGVCEEPIECARRHTQNKGDFGSRMLDVASTSKLANNKFNDICWETNGQKTKRGTVQIHANGGVLEEACLAPYVCKNRPKAAVSVCAMTIEKAMVDGKPTTKSVCPQLNDCINNDLSLPGYTERELQQMTAAEQERVMRQYEAGIETLVSATAQVSSTLPRQQSSSSSQRLVQTGRSH